MSRTFHDMLARLKLALGVSKDQEVAMALKMEKTAFSARKTRDSFPEKELRALAQQRPELRIDVAYVLSGIRSMSAVSHIDDLDNDTLAFLLASHAATPAIRDIVQVMCHIGAGKPVTQLMHQHLRIAAALVVAYEPGDETEGTRA